MAKIASAELRRLVSAFPEIGRTGARPVGTNIKRRKPGRKTPMTAAERKEVSERMKRYWASRRATKSAKK